MSSDHSLVVAEGYITPDRPKKHLGVNVTKTRVLVTITSIIIPGHIVPGDLLSTKTDTPFLEFPSPPFNLLCKAKHVRTRSTDLPSPSSMAMDSITSELLDPIPSSVPSSSVPVPPRDLSSSVPVQAPDPPSSVPLPPSTASDTYASADIETTSWYQGADIVDDSDQTVASSASDPVGVLKARELAETFITAMVEVLRSRELGDIWHLMHQFPISMHHGLRRPFARALRDAFFLLDPEDRAILDAFLESRGVSWDSMVRYHPRWLFQRCKRFVPPPEELLPHVAKVIEVYGPLKDAKTDLPLFNDRAWEIAANALENIRRGYYSDPPNVKLYFTRGRDKYGLMRYKCCRGTNSIEGGIHQNIIRWFGAFNAGPEFAVELLRDYCLYHNLKVTIFCVAECLD